MGTLGELLQAARQERGLSIAELEAITKIRRRYLMALENDQLDELPAPVYARGYVRTIATCVGLDPDQVVALYEQARPQVEPIGVQPEVRPLHAPSAITGRAVLTVILLIAVVLTGYYLYHQYQLFVASGTLSFEPTLPTSPIVASTPEPAVAAGTTPEAEPTALPVPTATPSPSATPIPGVHLEVKVNQRSWLRVFVDGQMVYEGEPRVGSLLKWDGKDKVTMRTGNAGGIDVTFNGKPQGSLGAPGEVKDIEWTAQR